MGIEKFFNSIVKNNTVKNNKNIIVLEKKIKANYFYIDFNSILYKLSAKLEKELNCLLYEIIIKDLSDESKQISKEYGFDVSEDNYSVESFKKYFTEDYTDRIILHLIVEEIDYLLNELIDSDELKTLYISLDGIPNFAKIIEQKRRRYNNYIIGEIKKKIMKKVADETEEEEHMKLYNKNKYSFDRTKLVAWHSFMEKIGLLLTSEEFKDNLNQKFKNLTRYVFSGANVFGEGEKKIIEDILFNKMIGKYVIYSPDSDVIILSMILHNKIKSDFFVMHYDQNNVKYDIIDINTLCDNIYNYVMQHIKIDKEINKYNVINDIAFLMTMFGNDFLPKIESIDVKKDYEIMLILYAELLNNSKKSIYYLTYNIGIKNYINFLSLSIILSKFKKDEERFLINDTYMSNKYRNYNYIKSILGGNSLHLELKKYIYDANKLFGILKNWSHKMDNIKEYIDKNVKNDIFKNFDESFLRKFMIIERNLNLNNEEKIQEKFLKILPSFFKYKNNKFILSGTNKLFLQEFDKTVKSKFHETKLNESMVSKKMTVGDYEKESYSFDNILGKYIDILRAQNDEIGITNLGVINGNRYVYRYENYTLTNEKYYKTYFSEKNKKTDINLICKEYLKGIVWVFDYYFNKNNSKYNFNNISTWHYPYHRAPLLFDLSNYLNNITNKNELKYNFEYVSYDNYFTKEEHYLFITPNKKDESLKKIVDSFFDKKNIVDCRRVTYLSKCVINDIEQIDFDTYKKNKKTNEKEVNVGYIPNIYYFNNKYKIENNYVETGNDKNLLHEIKHLYKEQYKNTRLEIYKYIYKIAKHKMLI